MEEEKHPTGIDGVWLLEFGGCLIVFLLTIALFRMIYLFSAIGRTFSKLLFLFTLGCFVHNTFVIIDISFINSEPYAPSNLQAIFDFGELFTQLISYFSWVSLVFERFVAIRYPKWLKHCNSRGEAILFTTPVIFLALGITVFDQCGGHNQFSLIRFIVRTGCMVFITVGITVIRFLASKSVKECAKRSTTSQQWANKNLGIMKCIFPAVLVMLFFEFWSIYFEGGQCTKWIRSEWNTVIFNAQIFLGIFMKIAVSIVLMTGAQIHFFEKDEDNENATTETVLENSSEDTKGSEKI